MLAIGDKDVTRILWRRTDRQNRKAAAEKWMCWVCDLDLGHIFFQWVIEGGIKLIVRSMKSITDSSDGSSRSGYRIGNYLI